MSATSIPGSVATQEDILRLEKRTDERIGLLEKRTDERIGLLEKRTDEWIGRLEKRLDEQVALLREVLARLDERVAAIMRMQNWNFALLVLVLGALLARIVF